MLNSVKEIISEQQFYPTWLGVFINPFYFARKGLYESINTFSQEIKGKTLDIGCGNKPYEKLFNSSEYIGLEIDSPENRKNKKADYFYAGDQFPFPDNSFDSVVTNQVFEHIFNPEIFLAETYRVLKDDGILLISVPFVWDEHEQPYDYARYSSFGLKFLLNKHGFYVIHYKKSMNDIRVIFQLINAYLYKITLTQNNRVNFFLVLILMSPFNILGELLYEIMPKNEDLYLDIVILAKKGKINE